MQLVDSHCHLNFPEFDGRIDTILQNARDQAVGHILCIATSWENQAEVLALAGAHRGLFAAIGVHPTTEGGHEPTIEELIRASEQPRVVGMGETGLDYYRSTGDRGWQRQRFEHHIEAARQAALPLIIHTRAAADDTLQILRERRADEIGGVMHCFAEDWRTARHALDLGFYISFSGITTFKSATAVQDVARRVPLDRLLIETDAPYLAPVPRRGRINEPAYVRHTADCIARLRGIDLEELAEASTANFFRLFTRATPGAPI